MWVCGGGVGVCCVYVMCALCDHMYVVCVVLHVCVCVHVLDCISDCECVFMYTHIVHVY